ncbi:Lrp/AsnC family transcriptional regulator [uncultured Croceicoccus sp.]|uniref:Lrp/AsnC family transcriptional regulator n=1 Tax=uncultured Croceicoccus sp. TaxID=1295329 RepID=UPI00260B97D4|nr:Lrp/AsnC family transcriptional regulator [uncultured Croceicoccus sp.]
MNLDRIDLKIIRTLQNEGRISNVQLADVVGLSASPCLSRVERLEAAGVIVRYEAQFDLARLGDFVAAYVQISMKNHRRETAMRFERYITRVEEVVEFYMVNGKFDYLIKVVAEGYDGPARVIQELWQADLDIESYSVFMVSATPISHRPLPLSD